MDQQTLIIAIAGALCLGGVAFALLGPSESERASKRAASLGDGKSPKKGNTQNVDPTKDRRKQVADSLKKLEEQRKEASAKKKVTLPEMIAQAGFGVSERDFYMLSGIVALVMVAVGVITSQEPWVIGAMGIVGGLGMPRWFLSSSRKKRQKKFAEEFSNAIDVIVRGVKSGLPVNECLKIIARDAQSPVKEEFHLLIEGIRLGFSLEQSLERMYNRMPINEVNFFAIVLIIQKQTGGNLADALGNLSTVLRSRKMMLGKIAALSMEAKASAAILAAMPFIVSGMVYMSAPEYLVPLYTTSIGQFMLIGAGVWMMIGVLVMKGMISIKV
ncbi:MAG: type II secretion system F family protein [Pseudomonadota bacterium]